VKTINNMTSYILQTRNFPVLGNIAKISKAGRLERNVRIYPASNGLVDDDLFLFVEEFDERSFVSDKAIDSGIKPIYPA